MDVPFDTTLMTMDEVHEYLNQVADGIPPAIFTELNGGVVLLPDTVLSPHAAGGSLYTMGTYHYEPRGMGRYININYGSFARVYRGHSREAQKKALREVLYHEFVHHLESMAGVRDLELKDEAFLVEYRRSLGLDGEGKK